MSSFYENMLEEWRECKRKVGEERFLKSFFISNNGDINNNIKKKVKKEKKEKRRCKNVKKMSSQWSSELLF